MNISDFTGGWFIGDFSPSLNQTRDFEVAVKYHKAGDVDTPHYHRVATEYTVVVKGRCIVNGVEYGEGDIIIIEPYTITHFEALTDFASVVVKTPSIPTDKYTEATDTEHVGPCYL